MNIPEKVLCLGFEPGQCVVIGSAALVALKILPENADIDLAVSPEVYEKLRAMGWDEHAGHHGTPVLKHGEYDVGVGFSQWSQEELLEDAFYLDGVPFISLEKLLIWKKTAGRAKDEEHIRLIEKYLAAQSSSPVAKPTEVR